MIAVVVLLITAQYSASCAPIQVDGRVDVVHSVELDSLYTFFLDRCDGDEVCADQRMSDFLGWLYGQS